MELHDKGITPLQEQFSNPSENELSSASIGAEVQASAPSSEEYSEDGNINSKMFTFKLKIMLIIFALSALVYILSRFFPAFAEVWTRYPGQWFRFLLAKITDLLPFSLGECVIIFLPSFIILYLIGAIASTRKDKGNAGINKWTRPLIALVLSIGTMFCLAFGPAFGRYTVAANTDLQREDVSAKELYDTSVILADELKYELNEINFDTTGASIMPYDYNTLVTEINVAFEKYAETVDYISHFNSNPKPISLSEPMTYTHISGVYTFMTGEANININYPDFLIPYTMAHEMAHQRGIAREDEANFIAFLVCIGSDDAYIRYCGYANMLNYTMSSLGSADSEMYIDFIRNEMPVRVYYEFASYSKFFDKYRDSTASVVTDKLNDTMIKTNGQSAGTKSYGLVVDLAVAYYKNK